MVRNKASESTFRDVYNDTFASKSRLMRGHGNHTSCEVCINCAILLQDKARNWPPAADEIIIRWRQLHLRQQQMERDAADMLAEKARTMYDHETGRPPIFTCWQIL